MQKKADIAREYVRKFPDAPTLTLTKKCYKKHGALWASLESCRCTFRYVRGNMGKHKRSKVTHAGYTDTLRPNGTAGTTFAAIPAGMTDIIDFKPYIVDEPGRYLILSDIHIPYHDRDALILALESVSDPAGIILNGDIMDHFALSQWDKDPRRKDFAAELRTTRQILGIIRDAFPAASIVYKMGNHEERYERYMELKAPELLDVAAFDLAAVLKLDELGITLVRDKRPIKLGKLNVIHGHEYRFSISNPVNPARGLFLRSKALALCGHFHQSSNHSENTLDDKQLVCYSTGALCDLHPKYAVLNKWNLGFAIVDLTPDKAFTVHNKRIINNHIY